MGDFHASRRLLVDVPPEHHDHQHGIEKTVPLNPLNLRLPGLCIKKPASLEIRHIFPPVAASPTKYLYSTRTLLVTIPRVDPAVNDDEVLTTQ